MTERRTTTEVPYSAAQMYKLVADVERYPEFLPWCIALRLVEKNVVDESGTLKADMVVAYKVFREQFRSQVTLDKSTHTIDTRYLDGPFSNLQNQWRFTDNPDGGSIIDFYIAFEFRSFILQSTAQMVFDRAFSKMSEAFVTRADEIYGNTSI